MVRLLFLGFLIYMVMAFGAALVAPPSASWCEQQEPAVQERMCDGQDRSGSQGANR